MVLVVLVRRQSILESHKTSMGANRARAISASPCDLFGAMMRIPMKNSSGEQTLWRWAKGRSWNGGYSGGPIRYSGFFT